MRIRRDVLGGHRRAEGGEDDAELSHAAKSRGWPRRLAIRRGRSPHGPARRGAGGGRSTCPEDSVAEVEDVPWPPTRLGEDLARLTSGHIEGREHHAGVEVALDAAVAMRRHASASGQPQSTLMTSEPHRAMDSRRCEVVVPKWMVGTPVSDTASRIRGCRASPSPRRRRPTAPLPTNRTAGSSAPQPRPGPAGS